jgi:hypothetical protein
VRSFQQLIAGILQDVTFTGLAEIKKHFIDTGGVQNEKGIDSGRALKQ